VDILLAILIAIVIIHAFTGRGRDAVSDGFRSWRNARNAVASRDLGAVERLVDTYRKGHACLDDRTDWRPVAKIRPDAVDVSRWRLVGAALWRGYKGGWTGETARHRDEPRTADQADTGDEHDRDQPEPGTPSSSQPPDQRPSDPPPSTGEPANPPRPTPTRTTTGGTTMTIATATGGEILTLGQLLAELDAFIAEAAAEVEDRQAAEQRARDDVARIELMLASLGRLELDTESLGKLRAIAETNGLKVKLARDAATNAAHRHALAVAAKATVQRKHGLLQEAHMAAGRDAGKKELYRTA
jgi:hypothetical protein